MSITPARAEQIPCASSQKRLQVLSFRVVGFQRITAFSFRPVFLLLENPRSMANVPRHCSHLRQQTMNVTGISGSNPERARGDKSQWL
jgi:hypothetical protein